MTEAVRILLVEDLPTDAELAEREIQKTLQACIFHRVETRDDYLAALAEFQPDLIISDYRMPRFDGLSALKLALEHAPSTPVIILTGAINEDTAVECMKAGATDYVIKEHIKRLGQAVIHALDEKRLRIERLRAVSARKQAEEQLLYQASLLQNVSDAIIAADLAFHITSWNRAAETLYGWSAGEVIGMPINEILRSEPDDQLEQMYQHCLAHGLWKGEAIHRNRNGAAITILASVSLVRDSSGRPVGIVTVNRDITERKQAEEAQARLQEQLRQAQKLESIGRLAGGIAHDFNNLLVPIMGYAELAQMELPPDSKAHADLDMIRTAAQRAASLSRQILAFSRRQVLEIRQLDLNEIITGFQSMLQRLIGEDIELQIVLSSSPCMVRADRTQIEQILMNLSVNARDAMPGGGKLIIETNNVLLDESFTARHSEMSPGRYIMLSLSDTGIGMDSGIRQHIFEPFFTTKEQGKGTGLGLATVFGIVKQHQGHILVYSEPGKGTTFRIYLPQLEETAQDVVPMFPEPTSFHGTETILVVEDEPMVRKLACETLELYGYTVITAENPNAGLQVASGYTATIHLLLTDMIMPQMNGRELYAQLLATRPELKVLYMSGYTENVILHYAILEEGADFIQKPFTVRDLTQKVRRVLDRHAADRIHL